MLSLLEKYPTLQDKLPHISLGEFPTPVDEHTDLASQLNIGRLYIKRDDLSGQIYGGNKVRKLEFLLGEAIKSGAKEVMTFGCAGSNHATATAIYSSLQGLRSIGMLLPQPNAHSVRRNLLLSYRYGAELHHYRHSTHAKRGAICQLLLHRLRTGCQPYVIPPGGSSPLGVVGYVNAAFELRDQIDAGLLPEPDSIYVPGGTVGTSVGLMLGLRAAQLKTRVVVVRVTDEKFAGLDRIMRLFEDSVSFLHQLEPKFPAVALNRSDVILRHDFFGREYALYTSESIEAVKLFRNRGVSLEGTYTGKTAATLLYDARGGNLKDSVVVFWNTYNSRDFSSRIQDMDYRMLPRLFHRYFEEDVQPLDRS